MPEEALEFNVLLPSLSLLRTGIFTSLVRETVSILQPLLAIGFELKQSQASNRCIYYVKISG